MRAETMDLVEMGKGALRGSDGHSGTSGIPPSGTLRPWETVSKNREQPRDKPQTQPQLGGVTAAVSLPSHHLLCLRFTSTARRKREGGKEGRNTSAGAELG